MLNLKFGLVLFTFVVLGGGLLGCGAQLEPGEGKAIVPLYEVGLHTGEGKVAFSREFTWVTRAMLRGFVDDRDVMEAKPRLRQAFRRAYAHLWAEGHVLVAPRSLVMGGDEADVMFRVPACSARTVRAKPPHLADPGSAVFDCSFEFMSAVNVWAVVRLEGIEVPTVKRVPFHPERWEHAESQLVLTEIVESGADVPRGARVGVPGVESLALRMGNVASVAYRLGTSGTPDSPFYRYSQDTKTVLPRVGLAELCGDSLTGKDRAASYSAVERNAEQWMDVLLGARRLVDRELLHQERPTFAQLFGANFDEKVLEVPAELAPAMDALALTPGSAQLSRTHDLDLELATTMDKTNGSHVYALENGPGQSDDQVGQGEQGLASFRFFVNFGNSPSESWHIPEKVDPLYPPSARALSAREENRHIERFRHALPAQGFSPTIGLVCVSGEESWPTSGSPVAAQ